jgi:hypothetical protein
LHIYWSFHDSDASGAALTLQRSIRVAALPRGNLGSSDKTFGRGGRGRMDRLVKCDRHDRRRWPVERGAAFNARRKRLALNIQLIQARAGLTGAPASASWRPRGYT